MIRLTLLQIIFLITDLERGQSIIRSEKIILKIIKLLEKKLIFFEEFLVLNLINKILKLDPKITGYLVFENIDVLLNFYKQADQTNSKNILQNTLRILLMEGKNSNIVKEHLNNVLLIKSNFDHFFVLNFVKLFAYII